MRAVQLIICFLNVAPLGTVAELYLVSSDRGTRPNRIDLFHDVDAAPRRSVTWTGAAAAILPLSSSLSSFPGLVPAANPGISSRAGKPTARNTVLVTVGYDIEQSADRLLSDPSRRRTFYGRGVLLDDEHWSFLQIKDWPLWADDIEGNDGKAPAELHGLPSAAPALHPKGGHLRPANVAANTSLRAEPPRLRSRVVSGPASTSGPTQVELRLLLELHVVGRGVFRNWGCPGASVDKCLVRQ
jgi:hypothetical protein